MSTCYFVFISKRSKVPEDKQSCPDWIFKAKLTHLLANTGSIMYSFRGTGPAMKRKRFCGRPCFPEQMHRDAFRLERLLGNTDYWLWWFAALIPFFPKRKKLGLKSIISCAFIIKKHTQCAYFCGWATGVSKENKKEPLPKFLKEPQLIKFLPNNLQHIQEKKRVYLSDIFSWRRWHSLFLGRHHTDTRRQRRTRIHTWKQKQDIILFLDVII